MPRNARVSAVILAIWGRTKRAYSDGASAQESAQQQSPEPGHDLGLPALPLIIALTLAAMVVAVW